MMGTTLRSAGAARLLARFFHRRVAYPILDFALPSACFVCEETLGALQHLGACPLCWSTLSGLEEPVCPSCALPRPAGTDLLGPARGRCASCVAQPLVTDPLHAVVAYDATARRFLLRAKIGLRPEIFRPLGSRLARSVTIAGFAGGCTAVVAVPSHPWMVLRRGFSPAPELARPVARALGLPLVGGIGRRFLSAGAVKKMVARRRRPVLREAFFARRSLAGERVLLIDDVMTTGATAAACAIAAREAGAVEVRIAVWARTLPPGWAGSGLGELV